MSANNSKITEKEALLLHSSGRPGKLEIAPTKPLTTQRDLSLAYSPGVAVPCLKIEENPDAAYDYTAKGNLVAVISNGTAVLGLGNLGALASKPVMEGKAVLFKRFADIDGIDIELATEDVDRFVDAVRLMAPTFGGINLEDIKAPECFMIEQILREELDIPVMHDDQHGTAIISAAGLLNAVYLSGRKLEDTKLVINGAGSAAIACAELLRAMGMPADKIIMCDTKGVIYKGRQEGMNQWKSANAVETDARTLAEALVGADAFFGLSVKGAMSQEMALSMADQPIIFAMANPDPEILPEDVLAVREDAMIATGRSDYPNQVNNVLGFPYIFRGALDVRASTINEAMKIAATKAIAALAREDVPDEVGEAYGRRLRFGKDYLIPAPFDPRLIVAVPKAVAQAAMDSGVARRPLVDMTNYETQLASRLDPTSSSLQKIFERVRSRPKKIVFAEGEEERAIRAAVAIHNAGLGHPVLVGREHKIQEQMESLGIEADFLEIRNAKLTQDANQRYADFLFARQQRRGLLMRDCNLLVNRDRNIYAGAMVAMGEADMMVTGLTRSFSANYADLRYVFDREAGKRVFGFSIFMYRGRTVFLTDTTVHERPSASELVEIAKQTAEVAKTLGHEPRVAFLSYSTFGNPLREFTESSWKAVKLMDEQMVDFEYDGEMQVNVALDYEHMKANYPFCKLSGPANILVMPGLHAANISAKLLQEFSGGTVIGPILNGMEKSVQIVQMNATVNDIVNTVGIGAHSNL